MLTEDILIGTEPQPRAPLDTDRPDNLFDAAARFYKTHPSEWDAMAWQLWQLRKGKSHLLMCEAVVERARRTNYATRTGEWLFVWIDPMGKFRIPVYAPEGGR